MTQRDTARLLRDRQNLSELQRHLKWYQTYHVTEKTEGDVLKLLRTIGRKLHYNGQALKATTGVRQWA